MTATAHLKIGTSDLRRALKAVTPHAGKPKDSVTHRVRLVMIDNTLTVSATNRYTMGYAIVDVEEGDTYGETVVIDIAPPDARNIVALFDGKDGDDDQPGDLLDLDVKNGEITLIDTGGLFEGKSLVLPNYGTPDHYPSVPHVLRELRKRPAGADRVAFDANFLGLFKPAADAYSEPIIFTPSTDRRSVLVEIGEGFIGAIMPHRFTINEQPKVEQWRGKWTARLDRLPPLEDFTASTSELADHLDAPAKAKRTRKDKQTETIAPDAAGTAGLDVFREPGN